MAWRSSEHRIVDSGGVEHSITIDLPHRYDRLDRPPVIVCLDGVWTSGTVRDATRIMSMAREAPEAIVVGVSFTDTEMADYLRARARWFTPTGWVPPQESGVRHVTEADTGHAATYRTVLRDEVLPFVASYAEFGERWLCGHSFSALFGLHVLFSEPTLFDKYLLASPSMWWDNRAILATEEAWASASSDLAASVFISAGTNEGAGAFDDDIFRMRANAVALADRLVERRYPSLELHVASLDGESHNSTISTAISKGLRALHAPSLLIASGDSVVRTMLPPAERAESTEP